MPSVTLNWVYAFSGETGFIIYKATERGNDLREEEYVYKEVDRVPTGTFTYVDVNVLNDHSYIYVVSPYNAEGPTYPADRNSSLVPDSEKVRVTLAYLHPTHTPRPIPVGATTATPAP